MAEEGSGHRLVLVRRGRFRRMADGRAAVIEPTMAYVGVPGEEEHFAHPAGGDVCTSLSLTPELWRTLVGEGPPARPTLYVDARLDLAHRRFLAAARGGDPAFELAESLLSLMGTALARLTSAPTPATDGPVSASAADVPAFGAGGTDVPAFGVGGGGGGLRPGSTGADAAGASALRLGAGGAATRRGGAGARASRAGGAGGPGSGERAAGGGVVAGAPAAEGSPSPAGRFGAAGGSPSSEGRSGVAEGGPSPAGRSGAGGVPRAGAAIADAAREAIAADHPAAGGLMSLAELLAVSPYRLSRAFTRELGVSLTHYRNRVRVGRALDRLEGGEPSLAGLAADLGFADQAHLTRTIRHHVGHTPTALRRLLAP